MAKMKVDINSLLDSKNQMLFSGLQTKLKIDVEYHMRSWYANFSQNGDHVIYVPYGQTPDPAAFAHELLHIDFSLRGMEIPAGIRLMIFGRPFSMCFTDELVEHISNCLNHIKMLPDFLQLGYKSNEFVSDFHTDKLTAQDVADVALNYRDPVTGVYNSEAVNIYIGKYFAARTCANTGFNYVQNLKALNNIDPDLFWVLEQFYTQWNAYNKTTAPIYITPHSIVFDFVENLEQWSTGKSIQ